MTRPGPLFDANDASTYDDRFVKLAPMKEALHLLARVALGSIPDDAHVLCVGVGTGAELLDLAAHFGGWRFTGVDPSGPMLAVCRRRVEAAGFADRVTLHEGKVDTLPTEPRFHAATSLLVSHFLVARDARVAFFHDIGVRLVPGALLVTADLAAQRHDDAVAALWFAAMAYTGQTPEQREGYRARIGVNVAVLPPAEVAGIVEAAGFVDAVQVYQAAWMCGWLARWPG